MISQTENDVNENVSRLQVVWRTEVNCPEIMPYQKELVKEIQYLLNEQQVGSQLFVMV